MLGAIIGDTVGSRFEWDNHKSKKFTFFTDQCHPTDDSMMTLAVAKAILEVKSGPGQPFSEKILKEKAISYMQEIGNKYPYAGYGGSFIYWLRDPNPEPYNSWGNGAAMRVSPCGYAADSLEEALEMSDIVTEVTHNHPEGIKGARAVTEAIYMAKNGADIGEIENMINDKYYSLDFTLDGIRDEYEFDVSCMGSVPQAIEAFIESESFEDTIRNAISIGGDSDTIAAIAGSIAQAYYGVPDDMRQQLLSYLDDYQTDIFLEYEKTFMK